MSSVAEFLLEFMLPLVSGGEVHVGAPIDLDLMAEFEAGLPHAADAAEAVDNARIGVVSELVVKPPGLIVESDELRLAAAIHNLLFLSHPRASTWAVTSKGERKVLATASHFAAQPLTRDCRRALARHSLLNNVFDSARADTKVSWWTGSATFHGQKPPSRLTSFRAVRRVREETVWVRYTDLLCSAQAQPVLTALLRRSPLTQLLAPASEGAVLRWEEASFLLRDAELARAVAYRAVRGATPGELVRLPIRYAGALEEMLSRAPPETDVRAVIAFLVYLNGLLALEESGQASSSRSPLLAGLFAPERAGQRTRGLATFFALPNAMELVDPRLAVAPGILNEPAARASWTCQRREVEESVGSEGIEALAGRLRRHLTPVLESSNRHHGQPNG